MASRELNEEKRTQMSAIIRRLINQGWTVAQLAAYAGQAVTTVRAWKDGRSMGTNDQRDHLLDLYTGTDRGNRAARVRSRIEVHKALVLRCDSELQKSTDFGPYRESVLRNRARVSSWIKTLEAVLP